MLARMGLALYATSGTAKMLADDGLAHEIVARSAEESGPSAREMLEERKADLVINIPRTFDAAGRPDGYEIRRAAVDLGVALITDVHLGKLFVRAVVRARSEPMRVRHWGSYFDAAT